MRDRRHRTPDQLIARFGRRELRCAARSPAAIAGIATAIAVITAAVIYAIGLDDDARHWLNLTLPPPPRPLSDARGILATNLAVAALPTLAAIAIRWTPNLRRATDLAMLLVLAVNAALVGTALAAYGNVAAAYLAPHGPLELAGFSVAGSAYLNVRTKPTSIGLIAGRAAAATLLIGLAAILEVNLR